MSWILTSLWQVATFILAVFLTVRPTGTREANLTASPSTVDLGTLTSLCKRRGFLFQSSEIYGGLASTWDYGPLGVELKNNVKDAWWRAMVWDRDDMVGLDAAILMHPDVWKASGHVASFSDPLVDCRHCQQRFRSDELWVVTAKRDDGNDRPPFHKTVVTSSRQEALDQVLLQEKKSADGKSALGGNLKADAAMTYEDWTKVACPQCGAVGSLTEPRQFNQMLRTHLGPVEDDASVTYLRPETAQGIFVNFANVLNATRRKLPFGIAQIGKSFRNEITTGNFIFRTREFEIMELEYFVKPGEDEEWYRRWTELCVAWYTGLGLDGDRLRLRDHEPEKLAHYSKATNDIEYLFPWGWGEIQGIANRTDFDLKAHSEASGEALTYFDDDAKEHITPFVIEPSAGVDRAVLAFLADAYTEEEAPTASGKSERRVLLKLHPELAPVKVAVLPLSRNERLAPLARKVHDTVRRSGAVRGLVQYDDAQSIGRRYRRQDEVGTPLCVTVDFDSLDDDAVTIRERDTMAQVRVPIETLVAELRARLTT
jgi:glycyl-tRNA synthetase